MSNGAMLSVREAAELLGIRSHSVTALIRSKQLVAVDVSLTPGGRPTWRITSEEFDSFLRRRAHTPTPPRRRKRKSQLVKQYF
jgi:excisionase family DNA binding protein